MGLLDQLPRLSAYDPGAEGEGGLDPLGLGAIADRIADVLAPGVRARMSQPRFVTLTAVGATAYQGLRQLTADEGKTTVDFAFEWLVVEAMVRHPYGTGDNTLTRYSGVPGNEKAQRAIRAGERLNRRTYLNGPRVFGFTGVYRPFSRDAGVLTLEDQPGGKAVELIRAWERDFGLDGYVDGVPGTSGGQLRKDITDACKRSLEKAECAAPPTGELLRELSDYLAPREAHANERRALRGLITNSEHEIRDELTAKLAQSPPPERMSQRELALHLAPGTTASTHRALQAAIAYEEAVTAADNAFRRFVAYTTQQHGSVISPLEALQTPQLANSAAKIGDLVQRAVAAVAELDDVALSNEAAHALRLFAARVTPVQFLDGLIERHEEVQANKRKLSWLDQIESDWTVRTPYRNQSGDLDDEVWTHPMRLTTLARFVAETAV